MTKPSLSLMNRPALILGMILASAGFAIAPTSSVLAQTTNPQPFEDLQNPNRGDIFSNRGGDQSSSMLDIIHKAIQGQGRSLEEYSEEQQENLDTAAEQFRKTQQDRLRNSTQVSPTSSTPETTTTPNN